MSPAYIKTDIENEIRFMDFLEEENNVKWWFKNEVNNKKYFAIKYLDPDNGEPHAFYMDFAIYMNDGEIGLFDTKAGLLPRLQSQRQKHYQDTSKTTNQRRFLAVLLKRL